MNCHECALAGVEIPAVALCRNCSVALCLEHLAEAVEQRSVVPSYGCHHAPAGGARGRRAPAVTRRRMVRPIERVG